MRSFASAFLFSVETMNEKHPWDQQESEPNEAYVRFLVYRNLGPARSIDAAYAITASKALKRTKAHPDRKKQKPRQASGQWKSDSSSYDWTGRAIAWDIEMLSTYGIRTIARFLEALDVISQKSLLKLKENKTKPNGWQEAVDAINRLGTFIPAETVRQIQNSAATNAGANSTLGAPSDRGAA